MTNRFQTFVFTLTAFTLVFSSCKQETYSITDNYLPCGWMECAGAHSDDVVFDEAWTENAHSGGSCIKVSFKPCEEEDGTGVYWINNKGAGDCNWGDAKGEDFSTSKFTKLVFWAKGELGKERIKFGIGGIANNNKLYKDSLDEFKFVNLTTSWKKYEISIADKNLHSIIGGFYWYALVKENPAGGTIYIDDVVLK